jgi:choline-sulfatase
MKNSVSVLALALAVSAWGCDRPAHSEKTPAQEAPAPSAPAPAPRTTDAGAAPGATASRAPGPTRPKEPLNVILLTIDSMRADMPWAGYGKAIAPNLTEFAKGCVVYENHRSVSSYTAQTVATLLSGRYASTLYRTGTFFTNYSDANEWVTEPLQAKGVRTMSVQAHLYFDRASGLKQGFDIWKMVPGLVWNAQTDENVTGAKSVDAMVSLLEDPANTKGQFFLWSHLMDPHDKYVKHEESPDFGKDNRGRYDSEMWFVDHHLGRFFEFAKKQPWWEKTVVMISADHGEAFGDHGMHKHAFEIWDVLTRVPLLVHAPGATPRRITAARSHVDIAPTIADLMGQSPLPSFQGKSLAPDLYDASEPENREPILLELAEDTNNAARRAVVLAGNKLIQWDSGKKALFHLASDPGEERDVSREEPKLVEELSKLLEAKFGALPVVKPYGGSKLKSGKSADGPKGP